MKLSQLYERSDEFTSRIISLSDHSPNARSFESLMGIGRSMRLAKEHLNNAFLAKSESDFYICVNLLEEETDEALHFFDNLRRQDRRLYQGIIQEGEELLSQYVITYNLLIEKNMKKKYKDIS